MNLEWRLFPSPKPQFDSKYFYLSLTTVDGSGQPPAGHNIQHRKGTGTQNNKHLWLHDKQTEQSDKEHVTHSQDLKNKCASVRLLFLKVNTINSWVKQKRFVSTKKSQGYFWRCQYGSVNEAPTSQLPVTGKALTQPFCCLCQVLQELFCLITSSKTRQVSSTSKRFT